MVADISFSFFRPFFIFIFILLFTPHIIFPCPFCICSPLCPLTVPALTMTSVFFVIICWRAGFMYVSKEDDVDNGCLEGAGTSGRRRSVSKPNRKVVCYRSLLSLLQVVLVHPKPGPPGDHERATSLSNLLMSRAFFQLAPPASDSCVPAPPTIMRRCTRAFTPLYRTLRSRTSSVSVDSRGLPVLVQGCRDDYSTIEFVLFSEYFRCPFYFG